jgi:hypothetical protein
MTSAPVVSVTEELIAELERDGVVKAKACAPLDTLRLIKEIRRLRAENEALRVDAGRYRHYRLGMVSPELLDQNIDTAMQSNTEGK